MIQKGESYNQQEFIKALGIDRNAWGRYRERIMRELNDCYDLEIKYTKTGRISKIKVKEVYEDYEYLGKCKYNKKDKETAYYEATQEVMDNLEEQCGKIIGTPRLFAKNIHLGWSDYVKPFHRDNDPSFDTIYNCELHYCHSWYGKDEKETQEMGDKTKKGYIDEKVWCLTKKDGNFSYYEEMTEEQKKYLFKCFSECVFDNKKIQEEELDIISDYDNGIITEEERDSKIGSMRYEKGWNVAYKKFQKKYEYYPIKASVYVRYDE